MNLDEIKQLIELANESGVAELEVQRGENRVRIRRAVNSVQDYVVGEPRIATAHPTAPAAGPSGPSLAPAQTAEDSNLIVVKSPIVGTYYEAPSPDADPFVGVGDSVRPGQVLCIIESMKLMNEIECEHSGVIVSLYAENGQPVEYGEPLMAIRPH
ncbi:MAG: acetyl-CoA carboxylase biotin carboxyl carrier protein [Bryobacterales bacterium]|jgi:acetyl-CoA carboxylase biotin carboxyl carrier protein|nr:acetyl-CoA carboxylase biotin carboxyl carrier protein [Bryobacterales bacterium]